MIYFDNAATSYPKIPAVQEEIIRVLAEFGGNPGRGDYDLSRKTSKYLFQSRKELGAFFGLGRGSHMVYTMNATEAANVVIKGFLKKGMHVVYSRSEHNAIWRPLKVMEARGIALTAVDAGAETDGSICQWEDAIRKNTRLFIVGHASNVTGGIQPLKKITALGRRYGIRTLSDMAQTAGFLPIDLIDLDIDFAVFAGHKGLLGPGGIGALYVKEDELLAPLKEGGTGSNSHSPSQPKQLPTALESGTPNMLGIGGLRAGIEYIARRGVATIAEQEWGLAQRFMLGLREMPQIRVYGPPPSILRVPVVSINVEGLPGQEVSAYLEEKGGIAVRSGLHCAPLIHQSIGTLQRGTVRFSFGLHNREEEVDLALEILNALIRKTKV